MAQINTLGPVGYNPTGEYDNTHEYERLDVVYYEGSSYVALKDSIGQLPTNTEYWDCIAVGYLEQNIYDSVADMKADDTLKKGMYARTVGYYSANDGGAATYKITDESSETEYQEEISNDLYATLIIDSKYLDVRRLGIFPDTNEILSVPLYNAFLFANSKKCITYIPKGTYIVKSKEVIQTGSGDTYSLIIPENSDVYFEKGAIIKLINNAEKWSRVVCPLSNVNIYGELTIDGSCMSITEGNEHMAGLFIFDKDNIYIEKLHSYNCYGDNIQISGNEEGHGNIFIEEVRCEKAGRKNLVFESGHNVHIVNAYLDNTEGGVENNWSGTHSIDVEPLSTSYSKDLTIDKVETFGTGNDFTTGQTQERANTCILNFGTFIQHGGTLLSYAITCNINNLIMYNAKIRVQYAANFNINNAIYYNQSSRAIQSEATGTNIPKFNINNLSIYGTADNSVTDSLIYLGSTNAFIKSIYVTNFYYLVLQFYANAVISTNINIDDVTIENCGYATGSADTNSLIRAGYYGSCEQKILINNIVNQDSRTENLPQSLIKFAQTLVNPNMIIKNVINNSSYLTLNTRYGNFTPVLGLGGKTEERPTNPYIGIQYYDTTLNKLISYNGTAWVNIDGSAL